MLLSELIGKEIRDIKVKVNYEQYGLDKADSFIVLNNDFTVGIPWCIDEDEPVWERQLDQKAVSLFEGKSEERIKIIKGKRIIDFLFFDATESGFMEAEKAFLELEDEIFITEITIAPNGTGIAGLSILHSKAELEKKYGTSYRRLSKLNTNAAKAH